MAVSVSNLTSGQDGTDDSDSVVASATYTAGRMYLLTLCSRADAVQPTISSISAPTSSGIVWTEIDHSDFDASGSRRTLFLYRGFATSTVSSGFTITWGATQTAKTWNVDEVTGMDTSGTQGSGAIVQSAKNTGASVTSLTVTLAAFGSTANATYGSFGNAGEGALVAGSGFTRTATQQVSGEAGCAAEFKATNDTGVDMTGPTMDVGGIAVEIRAEVIMFDAASNSTYQASASSYNWSHTTATGSNRYLIVGVSMLSVAGSTVSSITYNSVAMTFLGAISSVSGAVRAELWGLVAPSTGSNSIAVTLSTGLISAACAVSFTGVHQTSPTEGFNSASATNVGAADATVNVTTVATNDWVVDQVATDDTAITVGAGQTSRNNVTGAGGSGADSTEPATTPASVTMSWTNVAGLATWSIVAIALRDVNASTLSSSHQFLLTGVGA